MSLSRIVAPKRVVEANVISPALLEAALREEVRWRPPLTSRAFVRPCANQHAAPTLPLQREWEEDYIRDTQLARGACIRCRERSSIRPHFAAHRTE